MFLMYEQGVLVGFGIVLFSTGRVPTVGGVLPSQEPSGPPGLFVAPEDSTWEFPIPPFEPFFLKPGTTPTCFAELMADLTKWDGTSAGAASLTIGTSMHFALSDMSATTCESPPAPGSACVTDNDCPGHFVCSRPASRTARMLLFGPTPPSGKCVPRYITS